MGQIWGWKEGRNFLENKVADTFVAPKCLLNWTESMIKEY